MKRRKGPQGSWKFVIPASWRRGANFPWLWSFNVSSQPPMNFSLIQTLGTVLWPVILWSSFWISAPFGIVSSSSWPKGTLPCWKNAFTLLQYLKWMKQTKKSLSIHTPNPLLRKNKPTGNKSSKTPSLYWTRCSFWWLVLQAAFFQMEW